MLYAVWTQEMSSCWTRIDVFLWEKNMSSCWRRIYGYGRCLLCGEEYMDMEDVFLLDKKIWIWKVYMDMEDVFLFEKNI